MNRRGFLSNLIKGVAAFTILPPATTYNRIWKATIDPKFIVNPAWISAEYEVKFLVQEGFSIIQLPIGKAPYNFHDIPKRIYKIGGDKVELVSC